MKYRAYWKSTWYESDNYNALCRCLAELGVRSFYNLSSYVTSISRVDSPLSNSVVVKRVEDED